MNKCSHPHVMIKYLNRINNIQVLRSKIIINGRTRHDDTEFKKDRCNKDNLSFLI